MVGGFYTVVVTDSIGCQSPGSVYILSDCHNIIKGKIYNDLNGNCIQDSGEAGISGKIVYSNPGNLYGYTDSNGDFIIHADSMNNVIMVSGFNNSCQTVLTCPANGSINVNFNQHGDTSHNNNFAYESVGGNFDLTLHPGWNSANPGFSKHYWMCYYNHGPNPQNAVITFVYDSALIYTSCTQGGVHYPAQHKIEWTFNNVPPASIWNWTTKPEAFFTIPATFGIHDSLCSYFEISPSSGDCYPGDNVLSRCEPVTGSLDPNDKAVFPVGIGANGNILASDSLLTYTIRFQNTGNDTAFTVVVIDTLSPFLNPATIVPGAASHPYTFDLSGQGVLTFRFDNILLPDSNVNLEGSNGYFTYTVRQKSNNPIGTVIANTAYIYFDFNAAVVTNTVMNTIYSTVGLREQLANSGVSVYPNPFKDETNFFINSTNSNEIYSFELQDVMGKKLRSFDKLTEKHFSVSRAGLSNGVYFYKIYSKNGIIAIGKLVVE
ncbi:MAG: T9SS type A sorting domain-containing protein [Bacteroidetes bacterium]|nr:T9SS type A sorting domain-containing protein [Bacteroidota bacterium]